jgi:protein-disulfide isomerase
MVRASAEAIPSCSHSAGCLADKPYLDWPSYVTEHAVAAQVTGTPTVIVAGQDVPAEPDAIRAAVAEAVS